MWMKSRRVSSITTRSPKQFGDFLSLSTIASNSTNERPESSSAIEADPSRALVVHATRTLTFGRDHLDDLAPPSNQIGEKSCRFVRQLAQLRLGCLGEVGDHCRQLGRSWSDCRAPGRRR